MNDTPLAVEENYRQMLLLRSGAERLAMACRMFSAARRIVRASLGDPDAKDTSADMRVLLFLRTYRGDFDVDAMEQITRALRRKAGTEA